MSSNAVVLTLVWLGFSLHLLVGFVVARQAASASLVPALNLVMALLVLGYWAQRWHGYLFRGIRWAATDQLVPLYALALCVIAALALTGRHPGAVLNWTLFAINSVILLGACLLFTFLRMDRLV